LGALSSLPAAHLDLFGQPEPDQGIAGHVALVGRERDAPAAPGQAQRPRGRRRLEVGQPHLAGPTPLHEVAVVACPRNACSSVMTGLMGGDPGISTSSASAVPPSGCGSANGRCRKCHAGRSRLSRRFASASRWSLRNAAECRSSGSDHLCHRWNACSVTRSAKLLSVHHMLTLAVPIGQPHPRQLAASPHPVRPRCARVPVPARPQVHRPAE